MPKFVCQNKQCSIYGKEEFYAKDKYNWNQETQRLESEHSFCPVCGQYREPVKEHEGWSNIWHKAERHRNYDNKKIKQYDYDHSVSKNQTIEISKNNKR